MKILLFLILFPFVGMAQVETSANTRADVQFILSEITKSRGNVSDEIRNRFAVNSINGNEYVSFLAKVSDQYSSSDLESRGFLIGAKIQNILSLKCPIDELSNVLSDPNFLHIEIAGKIKPTLNKVPFDVRADSVWMGANLPEGYTGKDVIIGFTDLGFDYTSPNYYDTLLANTRILAAWDQYKTSGPAPSGYSYGTEFTTPTDLINAGSDTSNIYDYGTHGSHVAGVASGSGAGTIYRGIAFESELLFATFLVDESSVLDTWQWMKTIADAEGKRLVINNSWGLYHMGPLDGTSLLNQALDNLSAQGVVSVASAGNNGGWNFHIEKEFANDTLLSRLSFTNPSIQSVIWGQSIHGWGMPGEEFSVGIKVLSQSNVLLGETQYFSTATTTNYIDSFIVIGTDTVFYNLSCDAAYPTNGRPQARLRIKYNSNPYKIILKAAAPAGTVHFWNVTEFTNNIGNWGEPFLTNGSGYTAGNDSYGLNSPSTTNSTISVGAYAANFYTGGGTLAGGAFASFSSKGPLMNDTIKPDISAPGVAVVSSISSYTTDTSFPYSTVTSVDFNGRTYEFGSMSGTSMSAPVVSGVVALILDANPTLSPAQVKDIIIQSAREDNHTGMLPPEGDVSWGHGKINAYLAVQLALGVVGTIEVEQDLDWSIYPNPAREFISIEGIDQSFTNPVKLIDINGKVVLETDATENISISNLKAGMYFIRIVRNGKVEQKKFVIQ